MIDWKTINDLLINQKLEQIVNKWFGVDVLYTDPHGKIQQDFGTNDYKFESSFFKIQMQLPHGGDLIKNDVEKAIEVLHEHPDKKVVFFNSIFPKVKGVMGKIEFEGEFLGTVVAYPYCYEELTTSDIQAIADKLIDCGASAEDAEMACSNIKRIKNEETDYIEDLVALVAQEIATFNNEIEKREQRILDLNSELGNKYRFHNMIGKSKKMQQIYHLLSKISSSEATILIQGENGTGKELVAKAIHFNSTRKDHVFMAVNCSAFNDNLLDSELFGHVKGAFTGAIKDKKGFFETANGGTLFLDEVGDTSLTMQVKLLRVLQEGTFLPVGATTPRKVNVRVIAATNKNLKEMIKKGEFREDLYYRINVINIHLPALRERQDDIPLLIEHFLSKRCAEVGQPLKVLTKKCMEKMLDHRWPGNVRELENEIERLVVLAGEDKNITPDLLSARVLESADIASPTVASYGDGTFKFRGINTTGKLKEALEELERYMIKEGLKRCNFNKSKLAKELGISRAGLIMKVDKYQLDKRFKKAAGEE
jgi:transcriptional regulator with PAS, ATPase and Fis domain